MSQTSNTRMVIKDIDVCNFKSYAGTHKIGPFHKTFTAVIGPNGSGKSNVIDAMLFVFGKNAKKIRLDKLAELIHNSAAYPNLSHASVQVNFIDLLEVDEEDPDQRVEVEGSGLSVRREVLRSGASQYYINDKRSTQKEVVQLLKDRGVDLDHNRFLILQGEVEQIALMKPKGEKEGEEGLLEYFDDLIGTNRYVDQINEATKIAEECQESRLSSLDILRKTEAERNAVEDARDQCVDYIKKDNDLQRMLYVMCQLRCQETEEVLREPKREIAGIQAERKDVEARIQEHQEQIAEHNKEVKAEGIKRTKKQKEIDLFKNNMQKEEESLERIKTNADAANKQIKKEEEKLHKAEAAIRECDENIHHCETDRELAEHNQEEAKATVVELQAVFDKKNAEVQEELAPLQRDLVQEQQNIAPFEQTFSNAKEDLETAEQRMARLQRKLGNQRKELDEAYENLQRKKAQREKLAHDLQRAEGQAEKEREQEQMNMELSALVKKKYSINGRMDQIKATVKESANADQVVNLLNSAKNLKGYHGTLRQLGRIDPQYDLAAGQASTTWGYHVVDDAETATAAIKIVKENNKKASFIILEQVQKQWGAQMNNTFRDPPNSKRLFDLIQPIDKKFTIAFYFAVRDTLVTEDLVQARRLGLADGQKRYRCVTKGGQVVEPSGGIVGGGNQSNLQGAKLNASHARVDREAVQNQLMELQEELNGVIQAEQMITAKMQDLFHNSSNFSHDEIRRMQRDLATIDAGFSGAENRITILREQIDDAEKNAEKEKRAIQKEIDKAEDVCGEAKRRLEEKMITVEKLKHQISEVGGDEFKQLRQRLEHEKERAQSSIKKIAECKSTITKMKAKKESNIKKRDTLQEEIQKLKDQAEENNREEIIRLEKLIDDLSNRITLCESEKGDIEAAIKEIDAASVELQKIIKDLKANVDTLKEKEEEISNSIKEQQEVVEKYLAKMRNCDEKIRGNAHEFGMDTVPESIYKEGMSVDDLTAEVPEDQLHNYTSSNINYLAKQLKAEIETLREQIDFDALKKWNEKDKQYKAQKGEYDELLKRVTEAEAKMEELRSARKEEFMTSFNIIQVKLKEMYQMLTHGGDAEVELVDTQDPFEGINFIVRPPKKSWKQVGNLSGGEKTLSSLALVFALHHIKPTPIYVMDEIDAALDFRNVSIVARYVLEEAKGAQFIIISLRNNMFELAHQLVGICKVNDCTRSVALNPNGIAREIEKRLTTAESKGLAQPAGLAGKKRTNDDAVGEGPPKPSGPLDKGVPAPSQ